MKRPTTAKTKLAARRIGENISTWRKLYNLTSQQLADKAAVSRSTISRLENGDPTVSLETFLNVCRALNCLDAVVDATDPYETDYGRIRADQSLPQRVRC
ncbi:helix-turn-helix transcriptional regulator [Paratractidigestivibacter sp.]|uniref:helix-turn-helix transcriptional regulator n=1 Tax=Paratractidigestivibacter sp. TaxID=2847316 RepID=UPI002ABE4BFA|nr:helix-turn-helix transcriptional regulator [Paratractidigestivibacter sp.]